MTALGALAYGSSEMVHKLLGLLQFLLIRCIFVRCAETPSQLGRFRFGDCCLSLVSSACMCQLDSG